MPDLIPRYAFDPGSPPTFPFPDDGTGTPRTIAEGYAADQPGAISNLPTEQTTTEYNATLTCLGVVSVEEHASLPWWTVLANFELGAGYEDKLPIVTIEAWQLQCDAATVYQEEIFDIAHAFGKITVKMSIEPIQLVGDKLQQVRNLFDGNPPMVTGVR